MRFNGSIAAARISPPKLGDLGIFATVIVNWPDGSTGGSVTSTGVAGSFNIYLNSNGTASGIPNGVTIQQMSLKWLTSFTKILYGSVPNKTTYAGDAPKYSGLNSDAVSLFGIDSFDGTIVNPHYTYAAGVAIGDNQPRLNMDMSGRVKSIHDPLEFLRSALVDSDWDAVYAWYAYYIYKVYQQYGNNNNAFWDIAQFNLSEYRYITDGNGTKYYIPWTAWDIAQLLRKVAAKLSINDTGSGHVGFGFINYTSGQLEDNPNDGQTYNYAKVNACLEDLPSTGGDYLTPANGINSGGYSTSPYPRVKIGWRQGPAGAWQLGNVLGVVVTIIATYGVGYVLGPYIASTVGAGAASGAGTATAVSSTTAATTATTTAAAATPALETVVVTATAAPSVAATVAGAVAAGTVVATTAPAISSSTTASSTTASSTAPATSDLETVTVTGTQSSGSVSSALSSGAVTTTATAPAISSSTTATPDTPLEEVTVQGTQTTEAPTSTTAGAVTSTVAAVTNATQTSQQQADQQKSAQKSGTPSWLQSLEALAKALLGKKSGGTASSTTGTTSSTGTNADDLLAQYKWPLIALAGVLVLLAASKKKRKKGAPGSIARRKKHAT